MKKMMLGALAVLCAMLALPALASATPAHISPQPEGNFGIHGKNSVLTTKNGASTGVTVTGGGTFESTTTGRLNLTFTGVKSSIGTNCTNTGTTGEVKTTELTFHLVMLATNTPGILITGNATAGEPGWGEHFVTYGCGIFIPTIHVKGNGVLGTITEPACNGEDTKATVSFKAKEAGVQEHLTWTGNTYDLRARFGAAPNPFETAAMEAEATITFAEGQKGKLICTH